MPQNLTYTVFVIVCFYQINTDHDIVLAVFQNFRRFLNMVYTVNYTRHFSNLTFAWYSR